ncbi:MAG TPA: peptide ligase PGM1-related protein [Actinomycetota bacterium]|nr:peptide ligase PGM1-related protein [Actinomycetota bacterium]
MESFTDDEQTIVVVPTMAGASTSGSMRGWEERFLFLLFLLRQPRARLVYVTAQPIHETIVEYYLSLLPGVIPSHARPRFFNPSPFDGEPRSLTKKILERPRFIEHLRSLIPDPDRAHLVPYNTTQDEVELAVKLGIPMYGADPTHFHFGTKTGCRRLFSETGVPHPLGQEDLRSVQDLVGAVRSMRAERPQMERAIVKLNEGSSGSGNASLDLAGLPAPGSEAEPAAVEERVRSIEPEAGHIFTTESFLDALAEGGIVEERIEGEDMRSPSVQMRVTPLGKLEILSTHDQLLGGPTGQTYLGARFPADQEYAATITREAAKVGERLAEAGVIGRFAVDFIVVRGHSGAWDPYAIEVNLRKGGTTHPFLTLQFLTDGRYDAEAAVFTAPSGRQKCFVATDHAEKQAYRGFTHDDIYDVTVRHSLHFDQSRQTGVVWHMMSPLPELGRVGFTAVGDSHEEAWDLYQRTIRVLDEESAGDFVG